MLENLDVVVQEAYSAAPYGGDEQQDGVDAVEPADQQRGSQEGYHDDEAAHGGGAFLLHLALESEVADGLSDLVLLQPADYLASGDEGNKHAYDGGCHCPE